MAHEVPHGGVAHEHFLPSGPFALLPMTDAPDESGRPVHRSSLVWTEKRELVAAMMALDDQAFAGELQRNIFPLATLLCGNELLQRGQQIVVLGARGEAATEALMAVVYSLCLPNRVLQVVSDSDALPAGHPAQSKKRKDGKATAYLCLGQSCSLPVTEPETLSAMLNQ